MLAATWCLVVVSERALARAGSARAAFRHWRSVSN